MEDKRYYLRLEYFNYVKDTFNLQLGGGVRFRDGNLVPYLNINSKYTLYEKISISLNFLIGFVTIVMVKLKITLNIFSMMSHWFIFLIKNSK